MKRFKRLAPILAALAALYIGAYCLLVNREPTHSETGVRLLQTRYVSKGNPTPEANDVDRIARAIFWPLEWLDRKALPQRWEAPPPARRPPPNPANTTAT